MPWTPPKTDWQDGQIVDAQDMNEIGANLAALKAPPFAVTNLDEAADYTTNSTTFVDVSAARLGHTLVTHGGPLLITFTGAVGATSATIGVYFDLWVDGVRVGGNDGIFAVSAAANATLNASFTYWITNLAAGTHTVRLQWRVSAAITVTMWTGAGTANADVHPQFAVREVS
jgi:hypothetical protein